MQRRLILLRHGETEYNATSRMQGQLDTVLSDRGVAQAHAAAKELRDLGISKIVSSDLMRARNTAEVVAADLGLAVDVDSRLRETHLGDWQGKTHNEVDTAHEGARAVWRTDASWAPPRGESRLEVAGRARAVVDELVRDYREWDDSAVLLVSHGGTIAALTASLLGFVVAQYPALKGLGNANTARLVAMPLPDDPSVSRWYLEAWNRGLN
ncbi:histidine phosphatase family protein [Corynebacterium sp. zg912]|uniref:Histidine phosphatase family protein n=1 Tax=Corynebacterium wankanglinii TaxID=2735136 RepID=A0A7H0K9J2_9CORY|nr:MULTISPECIES: histidine phosphatase family protein [Corynebacterium]MBA1837987.1 histidine phosphatase family protein [Corynebacterium wankanglinii]MCR5929239.1 histidine phosphatase family protein [Corynebacterium sp. zg912]QNP93958.1 histidine phosphatase family protein [Corynebacterium wankanglinii]